MTAKKTDHSLHGIIIIEYHGQGRWSTNDDKELTPQLLLSFLGHLNE